VDSGFDSHSLPVARQTIRRLRCLVEPACSVNRTASPGPALPRQMLLRVAQSNERSAGPGSRGSRSLPINRGRCWPRSFHVSSHRRRGRAEAACCSVAIARKRVRVRYFGAPNQAGNATSCEGHSFGGAAAAMEQFCRRLRMLQSGATSGEAPACIIARMIWNWIATRSHATHINVT
jgi:hypothetical protein